MNKCETPNQWTRIVDPYKIKQTLSSFLKEHVYQVDIIGDLRQANALIADLRETMDKKRDNKWLFKQYHEAETYADKQKALNQLW